MSVLGYSVPYVLLAAFVRPKVPLLKKWTVIHAVPLVSGSGACYISNFRKRMDGGER